MQRELSAAAVLCALLIVLSAAAPNFYSAANLRDLLLSNVPVLVVALGMTIVILTGEIDISIGSQFALCSVAAGMLAKMDLPIAVVGLLVAILGAMLGSINGLLVTRLQIPSIVATLATMVAMRDGLRWAMEGQWVQDLPRGFQWFGLRQAAGQTVIFLICAVLFLVGAWTLRNVQAGRAFYAVGSDAKAARLAGIAPRSIVTGAFIVIGVLTGLAALLNSIRFSDIQSNAGTGLELKAIAAVVVGGTAITGGRGSLFGTLIGVALLGTIGTALSFLGINPFWEKAIQGAIILSAVGSDTIFSSLSRTANATA